MESQERHELKQNDLQEFFLNFREWWGKYGNSIMIVVIVCALGVAGYQFYTGRQTRAHNTAWQQLASSSNPDALQEVAKSHEVQSVPTLARLRAGDLLLEEAINPGPGSDRSQSEALEQAASLYEAVANDQQNQPAYRINAHMGLASVAETRKQWQAARNHWKQAIDLAQQNKLDYLAQRAQARRDRLDQLRQPVTFAQGSAQPQQPGGPTNGGALPQDLLDATANPQIAPTPQAPATQPAGDTTAPPATQPTPSP
jgi:hypothetical protein